MNTQPLIAENLNNYRRDDLYVAAEDAKVTRVDVGRDSLGRVWGRIADLFDRSVPINPSTAASGRATAR